MMEVQLIRNVIMKMRDLGDGSQIPKSTLRERGFGSLSIEFPWKFISRRNYKKNWRNYKNRRKPKKWRQSKFSEKVCWTNSEKIG
mgnify:CR=1 FL=1